MRDGSESPRHARSASPRRDHARSNKSPSPRRQRSRSPSPLPRSRSPRRRSGSGEREPAWRARLDGILAGTVGAIVLEPSSVYEELAALSAADASAVLDRFAESNLAGVKNPGSFLQGIVRRVAAEGSADLTTCLGSLPRPLRNSFARLMEEGRLRKGDVESRVATQLRDMPLELAQTCVDRYAASRLESIRSKTGFFIGIIKRVKEEASRGPPGYGAPPPYGAPHAFGGPPPPFGAPPYGGYGGPPPHGYGGHPAPHWYGYPPYEQRGREYDRDRDRDYDRGRDRDYGRGRDRDREYDRGRSDRDRR